MADTPRDPPGLNEQWSDEISALLSEWGEVSLCYSWLHNYSQRKYKRKYHHMSIPIIVLSTLTSLIRMSQTASNRGSPHAPVDGAENEP